MYDTGYYSTGYYATDYYLREDAIAKTQQYIFGDGEKYDDGELLLILGMFYGIIS